MRTIAKTFILLASILTLLTTGGCIVAEHDHHRHHHHHHDEVIVPVPVPPHPHRY